VKEASYSRGRLLVLWAKYEDDLVPSLYIYI